MVTTDRIKKIILIQKNIEKKKNTGIQAGRIFQEMGEEFDSDFLLTILLEFK